MVKRRQQAPVDLSDADPPDMVDELRRRDQPTPDGPALVPRPDEPPRVGGVSPPEDGGVAQHPVHDDDLEDLGPEDYEEMTNEAEARPAKSRS
jgi:hypothetical protein